MFWQWNGMCACGQFFVVWELKPFCMFGTFVERGFETDALIILLILFMSFEKWQAKMHCWRFALLYQFSSLKDIWCFSSVQCEFEWCISIAWSILDCMVFFSFLFFYIWNANCYVTLSWIVQCIYVLMILEIRLNYKFIYMLYLVTFLGNFLFILWI